jgi:hypothetical protein
MIQSAFASTRLMTTLVPSSSRPRSSCEPDIPPDANGSVLTTRSSSPAEYRRASPFTLQR